MKEKGFLVVILAACIAGFGGIFINNISMGSTAIAWMRTTVPTVLLGSILLFQGVKLFQGNFKMLLNLSFWSTLRIFLFIMAYTFTSIGNAVVVFYTYPIFTLLFAYKMLDEHISKRQIGLILLAFVGLVVIYANKTFSFADQDFLGMLSALAAAIIFAYIVILMKKMSDGYGRVEILFYQNFIGVILFLPFFMMDLPNVSLPNLGFGVAYGIVIGVVVYYLFLYGLKRMKASIASALMYVEIPSTIFFGWLILDETLSINFLIGAVMIVISSVLLKTGKA
ncbi:DMT family transporter [Portibacter lacus]|uniref:Membrane protein n=1 Tax=Portibacter lacus TaxID=1099794 RepID=A0AA37SPH9_9BACT|nr:EamA family transporter [Portibacter lacus]GLR16809.1 membrane protein [Portibacter lacus]